MVHEALEVYASFSNLVTLKPLLNYSVLIRLRKTLDSVRGQKFGLLVRASSVAVMKGKSLLKF